MIVRAQRLEAQSLRPGHLQKVLSNVVHVLALVTDAFGGRGGIARYNRDFLSALAQSDAVESVTILPRVAPEPVGALPRKLHQHPAVFNPLRYSLAAMHACATSPRPRLLFCGHILMSSLAAAMSKLAAAPLWLQVHGIDAWTPPGGATGWGAEQVTLVTSVSRYTKSRMAGWWNGDPAKICVLPNTVGTQFSPGPKSEALLTRYELHGRKVILTVARLTYADRYKGHDRVIAALPAIREKHPGVAYLITGGGDDIGRLRGVAADAGVLDCMVFAGHVPESELPDHFRLADVYVMPSTKEGFGIVFLEAALTGLPVIGGNADGSVDALADGQIGQLVAPASPEQLVDALMDALEGRRPGDANRVQRFCTENFTRQVARHVDQLVAGFAR